MRIAITGSWRDKDVERWKLRDKDKFFKATTMLGEALVALGHRLVVATDSPHTADRAAVDGAAKARPEDGVYLTPVVDLLRADPGAFQALGVRRPGFISLITAPPNADVIKLYQVHRADVVLAVGGAEKTLQATIAAALAGKRVVPLGYFGGAAERAVKVFEETGARWGAHIPTQDVLGTLKDHWSSESTKLVLNALGVGHPRVLIVHGRDLESPRCSNQTARRIGAASSDRHGGRTNSWSRASREVRGIGGASRCRDRPGDA